MNNQPVVGLRQSMHSFAMVPNVKQQRSMFDRSHAVKDTFNFDYLVPLLVDEVLPGDTFNLKVHSFARLATQARPALDNMYLDYFFFFVPTRLLWTNWEKFNGAQDNPGDSTSYTIPTITVTNPGEQFEVGTLADHFGLPTDINDPVVNALPFRAYNLIWNDWFRSEDLQNSVTVDTDNGPDDIADYVLLKRDKKHDYFTSCLPWPYKGDSTDLPLGTSAPVQDSGSGFIQLSQGTDNLQLAMASASNNASWNSNATASGNVNSWYATRLETDLSSATAATINEFRDALLTNSLYELDARGGTRYTEILRAHFGVISPDQRLQRPEFLGGGSTMINQHPVANTSDTTGADQGDLAAFSTAATYGNIGFSKSFVEHGYILGLVQARADVTYQQGLERMWSRSTRFDFFWPKLQQLGEQAVYNKEIYYVDPATDTGSTGTPDNERVFGYQERYAEYRYKPSQVRGQFRSTYATSLDVWHLSEEFSSAPSLNSTFIVSNTPIDRILAVTGSVQVLYDGWMDYKCARPMMTYGVPATLGRF